MGFFDFLKGDTDEDGVVEDTEEDQEEESTEEADDEGVSFEMSENYGLLDGQDFDDYNSLFEEVENREKKGMR